MTDTVDLLMKPALSSQDFAGQIMQIYALRGNDHYGEAISQREHAEQCAHHARLDGASDDLIVAALLHDIGHLLHKFGEDAADQGIDTCHERIGSGFLSRGLPESVTQPIALHVRAKRYLATIDPAYQAKLSPASLQSLHLQGGEMSPEEVTKFLVEPYFEDAMKLRHYDELGKVVGVQIDSFESYLPLLQRLSLWPVA